MQSIPLNVAHFLAYSGMQPLIVIYLIEIHYNICFIAQARIPSPLTAEQEAKEQAKEIEKKKAQEKAREEKERERKQKEEEARREREEKKRFLKLSDREKVHGGIFFCRSSCLLLLLLFAFSISVIFCIFKNQGPSLNNWMSDIS